MKNTLVSHTITLAEMFLHYHEYNHHVHHSYPELILTLVNFNIPKYCHEIKLHNSCHNLQKKCSKSSYLLCWNQGMFEMFAWKITEITIDYPDLKLWMLWKLWNDYQCIFMPQNIWLLHMIFFLTLTTCFFENLVYFLSMIIMIMIKSKDAFTCILAHAQPFSY